MGNLSVNNMECPLCGKEKRRAKDQVCNECYQSFTAEAGKSLAQQGKIVPFGEWAKPQATQKLASLQAKLKEVLDQYRVLQKEVKMEAYTRIKEVSTQYLPIGVFKQALWEKKKILWAEKGGNTLYWKLKQLEKQVPFLKGFLEGLKKAPSVSENPDQESAGGQESGEGK